MSAPASKVRAAPAFALLAALSLTALGLAAAKPALAAPGDAMVTIQNFDFSPMNVTVPAGASVTWRNLDEEPHTVTALDGQFRSGALDSGDSYTFKFAKPGVYRYLCTIHPRMTATVTVK